jgi:hypothetical protein
VPRSELWSELWPELWPELWAGFCSVMLMGSPESGVLGKPKHYLRQHV